MSQQKEITFFVVIVALGTAAYFISQNKDEKPVEQQQNNIFLDRLYRFEPNSSEPDSWEQIKTRLDDYFKIQELFTYHDNDQMKHTGKEVFPGVKDKLLDFYEQLEDLLQDMNSVLSHFSELEIMQRIELNRGVMVKIKDSIGGYMQAIAKLTEMGTKRQEALAMALKNEGAPKVQYLSNTTHNNDNRNQQWDNRQVTDNSDRSNRVQQIDNRQSYQTSNLSQQKIENNIDRFNHNQGQQRLIEYNAEQKSMDVDTTNATQALEEIQSAAIATPQVTDRPSAIQEEGRLRTDREVQQNLMNTMQPNKTDIVSGIPRPTAFINSNQLNTPAVNRNYASAPNPYQQGQQYQHIPEKPDRYVGTGTQLNFDTNPSGLGSVQKPQNANLLTNRKSPRQVPLPMSPSQSPSLSPVPEDQLMTPAQQRPPSIPSSAPGFGQQKPKYEKMQDIDYEIAPVPEDQLMTPAPKKRPQNLSFTAPRQREDPFEEADPFKGGSPFAKTQSVNTGTFGAFGNVWGN